MVIVAILVLPTKGDVGAVGAVRVVRALCWLLFILPCNIYFYLPHLHFFQQQPSPASLRDSTSSISRCCILLRVSFNFLVLTFWQYVRQQWSRLFGSLRVLPSGGIHLWLLSFATRQLLLRRRLWHFIDRPTVSRHQMEVTLVWDCHVFWLPGRMYRYEYWSNAPSGGLRLTMIGYVGRILLHANPFDDVGFNMQICCLIIAPVRTPVGYHNGHC